MRQSLESSPVTAESIFETEVRSYELDPYGHVNNAVYVNWLEHGRLVWLRERGLTYTSIPEQYGVHVVVVHQDLSYHKPLRLGDRVAIHSHVATLGNTSFTYEQRIVAATEPVLTGRVVMVCTGPAGGPVPIPEGLKESLGR